MRYEKNRLKAKGIPQSLLGVGVVGVVLVFLYDAWERPPHIDDAYISYRYARNLVAGHGLVFNPGEYVEGYTNFLWTLLVALGLAAGASAEATAHGLSLVTGIAILVAASGYAMRALPDRAAWLAFVPAVIVLASVAFARWATTGLETPLFVFAVTAALWAQAARRMGWCTAALCVATLTRPEGVLAAFAVYTFHLLWQRKKPLAALRAPLVFAAVVLLHSVFRLTYYGSIVPNTFYAKVGGIPFEAGVEYVRAFLRAGSVALLLPAAWAAFRKPSLRPGALFVVVVAAYTILIGGDVFWHGRFLLPALPTLSVLATVGVWDWGNRNRALGAVGAVALGLAVWIPLRGIAPEGDDPGVLSRAEALAERRHFDVAYQVNDNNRIRILERRGKPVRLVAATGIGFLGYRSGLPMLDLLGLVDSTVARSSDAEQSEGIALPGHSRSNANYVLSLRPDYLFIPQKGASDYVLLNAHWDLWEHPDFERLYEWDSALSGYRLRTLP